jgi:hypothetical protein
MMKSHRHLLTDMGNLPPGNGKRDRPENLRDIYFH